MLEVKGGTCKRPWSIHLTGSLRSATQESTTIRIVNSGRIVGARLTKDCCNMSKMSDMSLLIEEPSYDYLEKHMNVSVSTIKRLLQALKNEEKIRRIGAKRGEM